MRGTTRSPEHSPPIEAAGIEAGVADPDRPGTVLEQIGDVAVLVWLLGSALGEPEVIAAIHGSRLERLLEKIVDSPVRGFVYEAGGRVQRHHLEGGTEIVRRAAKTWRIPVAIVSHDPADHGGWTAAMLAAVSGFTG